MSIAFPSPSIFPLSLCSRLAAMKKMDDVVKKSDRSDHTSAPKETSWHPNLKVLHCL